MYIHAGSASWKLREVQELRESEDVYIVKGPMCRWGMKTEDAQGVSGYVRRETQWMTSIWEIAQVLKGQCANRTGGPWHRHVHLIGKSSQGPRAELAAIYPQKLVIAALKAFKKQLEVYGVGVNSFPRGR